MQTCPKCGYVRKPTDAAPEWQCPACQIAYAKFGTLPHGHAHNLDSGAPGATAEHSEPSSASSVQSAGLRGQPADRPEIQAEQAVGHASKLAEDENVRRFQPSMACAEIALMDSEDRNWLQILFGLPVIGAWTGFVVAWLPIIFCFLVAFAVAASSGSNFSFSADEYTGRTRGLISAAIGLANGGWLLLLQKAMRVRPVMPIIPIPWIWVMALLFLSGCLQIAGGSGTIGFGFGR